VFPHARYRQDLFAIREVLVASESRERVFVTHQYLFLMNMYRAVKLTSFDIERLGGGFEIVIL